jgi:hypothetical protein
MGQSWDGADRIAVAQGRFASVGTRLQLHREALGMAPAEIGATAGVPLGLIAALEAGDYAAFAGAAHAASVVREYSRLLGLPGETLIEAFEAETDGVWLEGGAVAFACGPDALVAAQLG